MIPALSSLGKAVRAQPDFQTSSTTSALCSSAMHASSRFGTTIAILNRPNSQFKAQTLRDLQPIGRRGRDCSRRTPLVLRFAPDRCSEPATSNPALRRVVTQAVPAFALAGALRASKIAPAILSNPRRAFDPYARKLRARLRPLGHLSHRA